MMRACLAVVALVFGCAGPYLPIDGSVCADPSLAPAQIEAVADAAAIWAADSAGRITPRVALAADGCDVNVRTAPNGGPSAAYAQGARIRVSWADIPPEQWAPAVAHELGHAMGAEHTRDPADLMYYKHSTQQRATESDVSAVLRAQ